MYWLCELGAVPQCLGYGLATCCWGWSVDGEDGVLSEPWCVCGVEQARDDCNWVNVHFGFCADVMTAPESLVAHHRPSWRIGSSWVGVCDAAAQLVKESIVFSVSSWTEIVSPIEPFVHSLQHSCELWGRGRKEVELARTPVSRHCWLQRHHWVHHQLRLHFIVELRDAYKIIRASMDSKDLPEGRVIIGVK